MKENKTESITFRTTKEIKKSLNQLADKNKRSVSNMIEVLIEEASKVSKKK